MYNQVWTVKLTVGFYKTHAYQNRLQLYICTYSLHFNNAFHSDCLSYQSNLFTHGITSWYCTKKRKSRQTIFPTWTLPQKMEMYFWIYMRQETRMVEYLVAHISATQKCFQPFWYRESPTCSRKFCRLANKNYMVE